MKLRLKALYERMLTRLDSEKALVEAKLAAQLETIQEMRHRLNQRETEVRKIRSHAADMDVARAKLEARGQRIPLLEKELIDLKTDYNALQNNLRQASASLAKAQEKGAQLEKVEGEKVRKDEQLIASQDQIAKLQARISELKTLLDDERRQASEKITLLHEARDQLKNEFQILAQRIFDDKTQKFAEPHGGV